MGESARTIISEIKDEYPEAFLRILTVRINGEVEPIGLFSCVECNKPISHQQFDYARVCGACDTGQNDGEWVIEPPENTDDGELSDVDDPDIYLSNDG